MKPSKPCIRPKALFKHKILTNPTTPTAPKPAPYVLYNYEKSCTRTEMPSKYKIVTIPKVKIEDIFTKRAQNKRSVRVETAPSYKSPHSTGRGFYYSEDNEILSVDEFFQVHKKLSIFREKCDKAAIKSKLGDKASKIEENRQSSILLSERTHLNDKSEDSVFMRERCLSARPISGRVPFSEGIASFNPSKFGSRAASMSQKIANREIMSANMSHRNTLSQPLEIKIPAKRPLTAQTEDNVSVRKSGKQRSMAYQQKFTAKEINKHAFHITVTPKKPRAFPSEITKELNYCKMFGSPKVMDLAVESCIKKGRRLESARNFETDPEKKYELGAFSSRSYIKDDELGGMNTCVSTFVTQTSPQYGTLRQNPLGMRIQEQIQNIDLVLNRSGITAPNTERGEKKKSPKKNERGGVRAKNKLPLRASLEHSNHIKEIINQHQVLSKKIKEINKAYRKEHGASSVNSQTYASYYM